MAQRRLEILTDRFLRYPENLTHLLYAYVRANSAQFRGVAADF